MVVAPIASQTQIVSDCGPAMLSRDDVVDLKRQDIIFLMDATKFAATIGAIPDESFQLAVHRLPRFHARLYRGSRFRLQDRQHVPDLFEQLHFRVFFIR